jgi:hypothetical protein
MILPPTAVVWGGGLGWLLFAREGRRHRAVGIAYVACLAGLLALDGRVYYLAPAYPMLLAAGGVALERLFVVRRGAWLRRALIAGIGLLGVVFAPMSLPCMPPETYVRYSRALGFEPPPIETHRLGPLPQLFADRFGWREMAETVAGIYHALPSADRAKAAVFGQNYGQAGAIDMYRATLDLPRALSGHLAYHAWGPPEPPPEVLIVLDDDRETLEALFDSVEHGGFVEHPYSMPYQHFDVWVCRGFKVPLRELWPRLRNLG